MVKESVTARFHGFRMKAAAVEDIDHNDAPVEVVMRDEDEPYRAEDPEAPPAEVNRMLPPPVPREGDSRQLCLVTAQLDGQHPDELKAWYTLRGFYVVAVPKISKRMGRLCHWIRCPRTVIMANVSEYVKSDSVCPEEQKYARAIEVGKGRKLVFTDKVRGRLLAARSKSHEVLHEALYREGGGFAQHSLRPNCEAAIENDGARVLIRSIENIFFGQ
eukprot:g72853.t1